MTAYVAFGWGVAGSVSLEVVLFCAMVRGARSCRVPVLYRRPAFIVGRVLLALVAGLLVSAWGISQPLQGIALGAATPCILLEFGRDRSDAASRGGAGGRAQLEVSDY